MVTGYEHKVYEFQFTPLREGRHGFFMTCAPAFPFQFTPLREGRPLLHGVSSLRRHFNSRPSARGDTMPQQAWN